MSLESSESQLHVKFICRVYLHTITIQPLHVATIKTRIRNYKCIQLLSSIHTGLLHITWRKHVQSSANAYRLMRFTTSFSNTFFIQQNKLPTGQFTYFLPFPPHYLCIPISFSNGRPHHRHRFLHSLHSEGINAVEHKLSGRIIHCFTRALQWAATLAKIGASLRHAATEAHTIHANRCHSAGCPQTAIKPHISPCNRYVDS